MNRRASLAIIGAGPKAAAIALRAFLANKLQGSSMTITVFDPQGIGANWDGRHGYTDGEQRLCTVAERDLGFPYASDLDPVLGEALHAYSWARFMVSKGGIPNEHAEWVASGRHPPTHKLFAEYLEWAFASIANDDLRHIRAKVIGMNAVGDRWLLTSIQDGIPLQHGPFDGVVVTGPGPARTLPLDEVPPELVYNGVDFWLRLDKLREVLARDTDGPIAIVGGGGTAAATLSWLVRSGYKDREIILVAEQATIYMRSENVFENRLINDDDTWEKLSEQSRRVFFDRINRGVVWERVLGTISEATRLKFIDGRAKLLRMAPPDPAAGQTFAPELALEVFRGDELHTTVSPSVVIDATGFDTWWFLDLLEEGLRPKVTKEWQTRIRQSIEPGLSFAPHTEDWPFPRIHVPFLSDRHGAGLGNLTALGAMAERVIASYLREPVSSRR